MQVGDQGLNGLERSQKSEIDNLRPISGISRDCKTEKNEVNQLKQQIKAEKELISEEQKYQQRISEINKKKK